MDCKWVIIGEVVATHGNRGEVRVVPYTEFPDRFQSMNKIILFAANENYPAFSLELESSRFHKNFVMLKLKGIDSISQAQRLKGMVIKVDRQDVIPLPPGKNYIFELVGLNVITTDDINLGVITDVLQTGANDVYVVKPHPGITKKDNILIPVIKQVVLEVNLEQQCVKVNLLDGLLE